MVVPADVIVDQGEHLVAGSGHGREWSDGACSRTTRVRLMRGRDDAGSRRPRRPRFHGWDAERGMARGHRPGSGPGTGRACLSPPVDCHDGRIAAYTAGPGPDAGLADGMPAKAAESLPEGAHPLARSGRGRHRRWPGRPALMAATARRGRRAPKAPPRTTPPRVGLFGRMRNPSIPGIGRSVPATRRSPRSATASAGTTASASNGRSAG